jgi:ribosome-associated protein
MTEPVQPSDLGAGEDLLIPLPLPAGAAPARLRVRADDLHWQFARSGGPGGQNVNKVATKALLRWDPHASQLPIDILMRLRRLAGSYLTQEGEILISSQRHRNQKMNMEDCRDKLRQLLLAAVQRPKTRKKTKPSRASQERRLAHKREQSQRKAGRRFRAEP